MAVKWPVVTPATWETAAHWNDGVIPGPDDDVYADGKEVQISSSITVKTLRTTQRSGGTAGGNFIPYANDLTIIAESFIAGTTSCFRSHSLAGVATNLTIIGNGYGGTSTNASGISQSATRTYWTIIGNFYGGTASNTTGAIVRNSIVIGNSYSGTTTGAHGVNCNSNSLHIGNSYGSDINLASALCAGTSIASFSQQNGIANGGAGTFGVGTSLVSGIFYGDCIGGTADNAHGVAIGAGYVFCNKTEGHTPNAFGISKPATEVRIAVLTKEEVGLYAKSDMYPSTLTNDTYLPFLSYSCPDVVPTPGKLAKALASRFN